MAKNYSAFAYKSGNSFLHKCPAWAKLLCIPAVNILFLCLPVECTVVFVILQSVAAFFLRFSFREQLAGVKPVLFYALLVFSMQAVFCFASADATFAETFTFENQKETVFLLLKLLCIMQSASLVFKTSTSLELRDGIFKIEIFIRRIFHLKSRAVFSNTVSLFLNFIPLVSKIWEQSKRAWKARGGKKSLRMYAVLLPVLFSVGMKKAYNSARALSVRM